MSTVNRVTLVGNLGKDPESFEFTRNGQTNIGVVLRVATHDKRSQTSETTWHTVMAFNQLAEQCLKYLTKGSLVYVEGSLSYKQQEGSNIKDARIISERIDFLSSGRNAAQAQQVVAPTTIPEQYKSTGSEIRINGTLSSLEEAQNVKS